MVLLMATAFGALALLLMAGFSWGSLGWLFTTVAPSRPLALPTFYVFGFSALASSTAFLAWVTLRPRLRDGRLRSPFAFLGHAMLLAIIMLFGLWLQSLRMLNVTAAVSLAGLYVFLELALLFGTRGSVDVEIPTRATTHAHLGDA